jgi:hypothetical protein
MPKPCRRCGKCCKNEICSVFKLVSTIGNGTVPEPPCPGLIKEGKIHSCIFVKVEKACKMEPRITTALGIGRGCDAQFIKEKEK